MKKKLHFLGNKCALLLLVFFLSQKSYSQFFSGTIWDAGITLGPSNFLGDLGGNLGKGTGFLKDNNFSMTKLMIGAHVTASVNDYVSFRLSANYGKLSGDDNVINGKGGLEEFRKIRNSNFRSKLLEAFVAAEVYPTVLFEEDPSDTWHKLRPYGLIGVGVFHFNPQGQDPTNGQWVNLKPLRTEGQGFAQYPDRKEYKLTQLNIPMGLGLRYFISENTSLSLEIIHRKTFTDYIDDVSTEYIDPALFYANLPAQQAALAERMANKTGTSSSSTSYSAGDKRGTKTNNDGYYSVGFKLGFRLFNSDHSFRNSTRCPVLRY